MIIKYKFLRILFILIPLCLLIGCAAIAPDPLPREPAVPLESASAANVVGIPDVRYDVFSNHGINDLVSHIRELREGYNQGIEDVAYLSISGGGDNGAFTAGLLNGWSQAGNRPQFRLVTGISTGALIAPFAFLGSDYDATLKELYTSMQPSDIYRTRGRLEGLFADSMADSKPLYDLISQYIDEEFLKKIAFEYQTNRRFLLIGTTNLDAKKPIIWNMGRIASIGTPEALTLFRKVMLASASIPGLFPPVMIDVEVNGEKYQEMHVDGGANTQAFLYPPVLTEKLAEKKVLRADVKRDAYIIRNADLTPTGEEVKRRTLPIILNTITQLIHTQGVGDLYKMYLLTQKDNVGFNLAFIEDDFKFPHPEEFDNAYMRALYDYGEKKGAAGYKWYKEPFSLSVQ
jgi:hypothetical protein